MLPGDAVLIVHMPLSGTFVLPRDCFSLFQYRRQDLQGCELHFQSPCYRFGEQFHSPVPAGGRGVHLPRFPWIFPHEVRWGVFVNLFGEFSTGEKHSAARHKNVAEPASSHTAPPSMPQLSQTCRQPFEGWKSQTQPFAPLRRLQTRVTIGSVGECHARNSPCFVSSARATIVGSPRMESLLCAPPRQASAQELAIM